MGEEEQQRAEKRSLTFDEASMERSKGFVKALQELKNLRPQLYSAAEYCEKSYTNSEQQQMVLDSLKDYAVRALVNAVDHLGTVAYKLTDLLEQPSVDLTVMQLKVTSLNQKFLTCQTYPDKEGLRHHQLLAIIPRHHKHYILPNSVNKKVHFGPQIAKDLRHSHLQGLSHVQPSDSPAPKTLSWHLESEATTSLRGGTQNAQTSSTGDSATTPAIFQLLNDDEMSRGRSSAPHLQLRTGLATPTVIPRVIPRTPLRDSFDGSKPSTPFRSFSSPSRRARMPSPSRTRSMISALFARSKTSKLRAAHAS